MASHPVSRYEISVTYMKCLRNHATGSLAIVLDGCCEFAPGGPLATPSFHFCAACGCHRHFHRRIEKLVPTVPLCRNPANNQPPQPIVNIANAGPPVVVALPDASGPFPLPLQENENNGQTETAEIDDFNVPVKKARTKITPDQKEILKAFAEKVGWTIRNSNHEEIMQVCTELGITRSILKNWINNNKKRMTPAGTTSAGQDTDVIVLQK